MEKKRKDKNQKRKSGGSLAPSIARCFSSLVYMPSSQKKKKEMSPRGWGYNRISIHWSPASADGYCGRNGEKFVEPTCSLMLDVVSLSIGVKRKGDSEDHALSLGVCWLVKVGW